MKVPFLSFDATNDLIKDEIFHSFERFFDSKWYVLGNQVKSFETEYAQFNNTNHCVGVGSGLDALILALKALDIKSGDEVIVPSNTYIASVLSISYVGATPVFVEPDIKTYNLDVNKIESSITAKTKAIMPVHLYGQACNMTTIIALAQKYNLFVIEDNAQSQGATWKGHLTGSFGHINATSFYPGKNLGAFGEAGAITTNDEGLAGKVQALRNYGSIKKYYNEYKGVNSRLDEVQAGFLSVKLRYLNEWSEERRKIASHYNAELAPIQDILSLPFIEKEATSVYHLYIIRTDRRDQLQEYLKQKGIGTLIHYPVPPHLQKAYAELGFKQGDFPIAEELANTMLSLPIFIGMKVKQINYICETIKLFFK